MISNDENLIFIRHAMVYSYMNRVQRLRGRGGEGKKSKKTEKDEILTRGSTAQDDAGGVR